MEQHLPIVAKKFLNLVRVALYMLKKGISKSKLLADLNMLLKRGKLAGKAIQNLMFHHTHLWAAACHSSSSTTTTRIQRSTEHQLPFTPNQDECQFFSCNPSPDQHHGVDFQCKNALSNALQEKTLSGRDKSLVDSEEGQFEAEMVVMRAIEMLKYETTSPALGDLVKRPMVRQLRVTDSPYPINYAGNENDKHVDEAADQFIKRFYKNLRRQNKIAWGTPGR
ncbi:hypothetical protein LIER_34443 [Lithospermum erythrorhizon]|uniref:Avr9/Cf-9 rapidly elicited protein 146 n=1 Tax=Lithospermum erythrorhizon TaxID=34254 RepID=A0AAV3S2E3_LITER